MNEENINTKRPYLKILVAPLDWGLGHATRCIPIIQSLLYLKINVILAAEGQIAGLLQKEFPALVILPLPGYSITYGKNKSSFKISLLKQIPKILDRVKQENEWLKSVIREHQLDAVISDNRLGLYSNIVPTVYITHQLSIQTGYKFTNWMFRKLHYRYINRYQECWVPDDQGAVNLGGLLSHPDEYPNITVRFTGPLSRFKKKGLLKNNKLLLLLSGPEPQRSIFENILLEQVKELNMPAILIRGLPGNTLIPAGIPEFVTAFNHLPASELSGIIESSEMIICRSGYSTLMDLAALEQRAIIIPTPGQTEQEYLALYLNGQKLWISASQESFNLEQLLKDAAVFDWKAFPAFPVKLETLLRNFIEQIRKPN